MKKCLKLVPSNQNHVIYILFLLVLLPAKDGLVPKKEHSKKNLVRIFGSSSDKVILILLTEVIAFHIGFTAIYVWGSSFQRLVPNFSEVVGGWNFKNVLKICCKYFLVYLGVKGLIIERFGLERPANRLDNMLSNPGGEKELEKATKRCFFSFRDICNLGPRSSWSSLKHSYPNGLTDLLGI